MTEYRQFPFKDILNATPIKNIAGSVDGVRLTDKGTFIFPRDLDITAEAVQDFIRLHDNYRLPRLLESHYMYLGEHEIKVRGINQNGICGMPDNRLTVNFPRYIVDTFNGYFIGIPPKVSNKDIEITKSIQNFVNESDLNDKFAELSKITSIYGHGYAYIYQSAEGTTQMTYNSPLDMFIIYDDTIQQEPLFAVRFWIEQRNGEQYKKGELYTPTSKYLYSEQKGGALLEEDENYDTIYERLPVVEFLENDYRQSVFEPVKSLINDFNKALSEKSNDVEYFANAYMKVLGAKVDNATLTVMQKNRVINAVGAGSQNVEIDFMDKPDADQTQENLLDRLTDLIFITSMVANTTDDTYGNASGTALEFKLQDMRNMSIAKERKFTSGLTNMFKVWFEVPLNVPAGKQGDWKENTYIFTENIPRNVKEEIENAKALEGIVTREKQLELLSFIDDVPAELEALEKENDENMRRFEEFGGMSAESELRKQLLANEDTTTLQPVEGASE